MMETRPVAHPSADVLKAFGLGKLDDTSAGVVMDHLDLCMDCRREVAALSGDDFLDRLRQAHGRSATPAPNQALSDSAASPKPRQQSPPSNQTTIPNLPAELANSTQYEVLRELGHGGMGVVYLAKNKLMDRLEVLKVINKALLDRPDSVERFLREIRSAAKLSHANVVAAYSAVQVGELLAFAMEYVEGEDLAKLVKTQGPLPLPHACFYVQQAARGLQHAFEEKMVHRDIKPQNLMLARKDKKHIVKVLDFGLAKATREKSDDTGLTGEGKMLGTPDYIAPEQTLDAAKADIRADIYSLGCTLYYLLSGRPPFSASSLGAILLAHQMQEAKPLNLVRPEVPEELASVVRKMMAKEPAKRYQTPLEVVQALSPFVKQGAMPKSSPELSSGAAEPKPAVKKASRVYRPAEPAAPAAEEAKVQPEPAVVRETLLEHSIPSLRPRKSGVVRPRRAAPGSERTPKKWLLGGGLGVGVLLLALLGMWAGGVFKVKTKDGTIVLENLPPDAEVLVDGEKVTLQTIEGNSFAISIAPGKKQRLQVKKQGFTTFGEEVEIDAGGRRSITVHLESLPVASADAERQAAEWALALKGTIRVRVKGEEKEIGPDGNLPTERFQLLDVNLSSKPAGDEGVVHLKGLSNLRRLLLWNAGISDAGLAHLKDLTGLRELGLFANPKVTDDGLAHLKSLTNLHNLDLNATSVTDAGMVHLKELTNLAELNLMSTRVSGAGFVHLAGLNKITLIYLGNSKVVDSELARLEGLNNLKVLSLHHTSVSDAGLVHLKGLKQLRELHLLKTKVTNAGVADLQKALPACRIHSDLSAVAPADKPAGPKADYDALATGSWIALLPSQEEFERLRSQKSYMRQEPRFDRGILETKGGGRLIFPAIDATNLILRTRVKKLSPKGAGGLRNVGLSLRQAPGKAHYDAWFNGGGEFGIQRWDSSQSPPAKLLATCKLVEDYTGFFEFAFAAVGDKLAVYANGKKVLEAHGPEILEHSGRVIVGGEGLFRDIEVQVLDPAAKPTSGGNTEFRPLFNGKDLTGWKPHPDDTAKWEVKDGILIGSGGRGHLFSERGDYENFHLRVEAMINNGGNSGQYFRSEFASGFPKGYEAQINSTARDPQKTGSLYGIVKITEQLHKPDEWFTQEVIAEGDHIVIKVNGKTVVDTHDSRYKKGHIALQQHDPATVVKFRKIEIKEVTAKPSSPRASDGLPPEAKEAAKAFEKSCADAREKFLAEFDTALDRVAKAKGSTEQRVKLINAIKEEKKRFEDRGLIPWSEPMRPFLAKYFASTSVAESKVRRVYNSLIDAQLRAKNESQVADLRADLENLVRARIVARWRHFLNGRPSGIPSLYSNGRVNNINGDATWTYSKGVLIYRFPNPKAPGGTWIDTYQVSADGATCAGTNNAPPGNRPKFTGVYVKPD
ncbi:MAG TPA: family 16 glycoside hydrolase [Gemmataceae bacterium]|jgi:serine/threonine protein kinase